MTYTQAEADIIVADSFDKLNYKCKKLFLASLGSDDGDGQKYADALIKICGEGVYNKLKAQFCDGAFRSFLLKEYEKRSIVCVTLKSALYPEGLKHIEVPQLVLYARGNYSLLSEETLAIVGSRKTAANILEECKRFSQKLTDKFVIVTGVADGADAAAAKGALPSGRIICVLPGGHDSSCGGNIKVLREVERRGLSISEFPPLFKAQRYTFILRNRIIAGLTKGVLVVSAAEKSGALNTANYAADYGKDVFAFPYGLGVSSGAGCNKLIKNGAYLCDDVRDIFSVTGTVYEENKEDGLEPDERAIVELLSTEGEMHAQVIAEKINKPLGETTVILAMLEIKGRVAKTGGNKFSIL